VREKYRWLVLVWYERKTLLAGCNEQDSAESWPIHFIQRYGIQYMGFKRQKHVKAPDFRNGTTAQFKLTYEDPHNIDKKGLL